MENRRCPCRYGMAPPEPDRRRHERPVSNKERQDRSLKIFSFVGGEGGGGVSERT